MQTSEPISEALLEVRHHHEPGYRPLVDFDSWRVAVLNFAEELRPENLTRMQRHNETDEVFVLLRGQCLLFIGEGRARVTTIQVQPLTPHKLYNVKRAVWHHHALSEDAMVLVVENRATTYDNSPFCALTAAQQGKILQLTGKYWPSGK